MKTESFSSERTTDIIQQSDISDIRKNVAKNSYQKTDNYSSNEISEILVVTSFPPRECGIATYSQDLIKSLNNKFNHTLSIKVCALESGVSNNSYPEEVKYILNTSLTSEYQKTALKINQDANVEIILVQHEFGFFREHEEAFLQFLFILIKPVIIVFHTVLPHPDILLKSKVKSIATVCESVVVMTHTSNDILVNDYNIPSYKIAVIPHGTHLVPHINERFLKIKYNFKNRKVLTTFGLLSSGKSIETTLDALPAIVKECPTVLFLIIGKTHPEVVKNEGEKYREKLMQKVDQHGLHNHVLFVNNYLALPDLLEYLQLTDIYLFTTNDPNQAVSGTFAYAMSCACPIISTPIPHAKEVLTEDTGIIFDFQNSQQLADGVIRLLNDEPLRKTISLNALQKIVSTSWENSAVAHARLFEKIGNGKVKLHYILPQINLNHLRLMTTETGIIQFSKVNQPDISSGYTLDDNARAMVAMCMHYKLTNDLESKYAIQKYLDFIKRCQHPYGDFINYIDKNNRFTLQNKSCNLEDSNGRAIWALGYLISAKDILPKEIISEATTILQKAIPVIETIHSTRAMAFAIKGLYYFHTAVASPEIVELIKTLANRLVQMFKHEANKNWNWFESYLTYSNSVLPEALLYAWKLTGEKIYKDIAISSFDFLMSQIFNVNGIEVISNRKWLHKGEKPEPYGEQPVDVAYTILTLNEFYSEFKSDDYKQKMDIAFNWFLGNNRLQQIVYNPCTGGCYDGLEETHANLNQGAESTISYLMARLTMEEYNENELHVPSQLHKHHRSHIKKNTFIYSTSQKKLLKEAEWAKIVL